jgi:uncharacterized protein (DUF362 family)
MNIANRDNAKNLRPASMTRRDFFKVIAAGGVAVAGGLTLHKYLFKEPDTETFIASINGYHGDIRDYIIRGLKQIGVSSFEIKGKRVLLKPNLVEPHGEFSHINTHPSVIQAAAEAFLHLGARTVIVAEGAGHRRVSLLVLEESGLADVLYEDKIPFVDLNSGSVVRVKNTGGVSKLSELFLPEEIFRADVVVSIAKMKTHHWAGVTLSMKNLFGLMPGMIYGWPKNVLHWAGINECIYDINATVSPEFAIVDGIVGMEGDGPIMGDPVKSNVLVMGRNFPAVDATCARIMGIDPKKISYLKYASGRLGAIKESNIGQRGESIASVQKEFHLVDYIPAHRGISLRASYNQICPKKHKYYAEVKFLT